MVPWNTSPPAVASVPPFHGPLWSTCQASLPAIGSQATSLPFREFFTAARAFLSVGMAFRAGFWATFHSPFL